MIDMFHLRIIGCLNDLTKRQLMFASFLFKYIRKMSWLGWWQNITTSSWLASNGNCLHGFVVFAWMIFEFISSFDWNQNLHFSDSLAPIHSHDFFLNNANSYQQWTKLQLSFIRFFSAVEWVWSHQQSNQQLPF